MNTAQKIIKYFAIAFAMLLIFSIFSGIIFGGFGLLTASNFLKTSNNAELSCSATEVPCLKISLAFADLEIKSGDSLSASSNYDKIEIKQSDGELLIAERNGELFSDKSRKVTVYVPTDVELKIVEIKGGAGRIEAEALKVDTFDASLGIGETVIKSLDAKTAKLSTGIGKLSLNLVSPKDDYEIKAKKGIGKLTINGSDVSGSEPYGSGERKVEVSGGIGDISITTKGEN